MSKVSCLILCVALLFCCARADEVNFKDCGCKIGTIQSVSIDGCDTSESRCVLKRNTNATIEVKFIAGKDAAESNVVVHGVILDAPVPFPLPNPDACKDSGIVCPIKSGSTYTYTTALPILKKYPRVTVDIKWEIQSGGEDFVCVLIPAKLQ